jgi:small GTP-binding protein
MTNFVNTSDNQYRIGFLGACKVGKTSILNQLVFNTFTWDYEPTLETDIDYITKHKENTFYCLLVDTYGGSDFPAMRKLSITRCRSFIVVFSLTDDNTYIEAKRRIDEIRSLKGDGHVNIALVGNKRDVTEGAKIHTEEIYCYCDSLHEDDINCKFIKVSAMDNDDVINMFNMLLNMIAPDIEFPNSSPWRRRRSRSRSGSMQIEKKKSPNNCLSEDAIPLSKGNRSPSLFSLHNFSSDDDITNFNYTYGEETKRKGLFKKSKAIDILPPQRKLSVYHHKIFSSL